MSREQARNGKAPVIREIAIIFKLLSNLDAFSTAVAGQDNYQNSKSNEN
jgi:hypothetical protein